MEGLNNYVLICFQQIPEPRGSYRRLLGAYLWLPSGDGQGAILFKGQGAGIEVWVAKVDEISEGIVCPLDLLEERVKVQCRGQAQEEPPLKGLRVFHPTWE